MRQLTIASYLAGLALLAGLASQKAEAQSLPACQPPRSDEYLLLVPNTQSNTEARLRQLLPANAAVTPCNYLNDRVIRVGGFVSVDIANAWAKYLNDSAGLRPTVVRPQGAAATPSNPSGPAANAGGASGFPTPTLPNSSPPANNAAVAPTPAAATQPQPQAYSPQPLGTGYAVLVNYSNRPEVAADLYQVTKRPVGLVAYDRRPFLLAIHTTDQNAASNLFRSLSAQGFAAVVVDSSRAVLLTPAVIGTGGR